jgi:hypothetical protein
LTGKGASDEKSQIQAQEQKKASDLAITSVFMDQVDSTNQDIKNYLEALQHFIACKKLHDTGGVGEGYPSIGDLHTLAKKVEYLNLVVGEAINLLNISITYAYRTGDMEKVTLATQLIARFKRDHLDTMLMSPEIEDEVERAELAKRLAPIIGTIARILAREKVGIVPPPKLTEITFTEETVGAGMSTFFAAGHAIKSKLKTTEKDPTPVDALVRRTLADESTKDTVEGMKRLAKATRESGMGMADMLLQDVLDKSKLKDSDGAGRREEFPSSDFRTEADKDPKEDVDVEMRPSGR